APIAQAERALIAVPPALHAPTLKDRAGVAAAPGNGDGGLARPEVHGGQVIAHLVRGVATIVGGAGAEATGYVPPPAPDVAIVQDSACGGLAGRCDQRHRAQASRGAGVAVARIPIIAALPLLEEAIPARRELAGRRAAVGRVLVIVVTGFPEVRLHVAVP